MTKFRLVGVAALAALTIAGCGGDDNSSNKTLSYAATGTELNNICKAFQPKLDSLGNDVNGDPAHDAPIWDQAVSTVKDSVDKIKALKVPTELQADFAKFTSVADQQLAILEKGQAAAKSGDKANYVQTVKGSQSEAHSLGQQGNLAASKLGAGDCIDKSS
jgi:hypothetical protein